MAEEVAAAKLARERAAREARMEEAITRARMRLEHEESASWSRRLEQAALAVRLPCLCGPQGLALCISVSQHARGWVCRAQRPIALLPALAHSILRPHTMNTICS